MSLQPLDSLHANVAQAVVPTQPFLFGFREIDVGWLGEQRVVTRWRGPIFVGFLTFVGNRFGSSLLVTHMLGFLTLDDFCGTKREVGYTAVIHHDAR